MGDHMNYTKYENNSYNLHIIKTDKFKTNMIKINFKKKLKKEDITLSNLLTKIILLSNKTYTNKRELEIASEELYGISMSATTSISGNYLVNSFSSIFLNEKYTEKEMTSKSIKFIFDIIFNPDITDNEFNNFNLAKRLVEDEINTIKDNPKGYSQLRMLENMDKTRPHNAIGYIEDLEKITNKDLYKFFQSLIKSNIIDVFIIGDLDTQYIKETINKYLTINTLKKPSDSHFLTHKKIRKTAKTVIETLPLEQAKLSIGFKIDNLTDFEKKYVMNIFSYILGGSPDSKLFKNIREKNSLCYYVYSNFKPVTNILTINAGIDKKDFKKCVSLIKKEVSKMSKGDFSENDINAAKVTYISSLKDVEDNQPSILKIFESHEYLKYDLLDERANNIINVTKEDIVNVSKKIFIHTIYLLEGENNEEGKI